MPNYVKPLFFEVSPLNPLPGHRFDKSQIITTSFLDQSPIEFEMSLGPASTQILIRVGLVSEEMVCGLRKGHNFPTLCCL